jgi:universal stress protein A
MKTRIKKPHAFAKRIATPRRETTRARRQIGATENSLASATLRIKSILVPIDFSPPSKQALAYAAPFAEHFGAKLTLMHVVELAAMPDFAKSFPLSMENDKLMALSKRRLESVIREQAIGPKLIEKTLVDYGRSYQMIVDAARTLKVDLIIISTHGYTGLKRAVLGSTTERVVRHAPCPVFVVREHEHEFLQNIKNRKKSYESKTD